MCILYRHKIWYCTYECIYASALVKDIIDGDDDTDNGDDDDDDDAGDDEWWIYDLLHYS